VGKKGKVVMGDHYGDNPELDKLDYIGGNLIDIETEQQKTNELLGQILVELKRLNGGFVPSITFSPTPQSGYRCMRCGGWVSTPDPHLCSKAGQFT
jgi:hypothetical protein